MQAKVDPNQVDIPYMNRTSILFIFFQQLFCILPFRKTINTWNTKVYLKLRNLSQ